MQLIAFRSVQGHIAARCVILSEAKNLIDTMQDKTYYVYILTNWNNCVLYIGVTNNIQRRVYEHKNGLVDGFTKKYNVHKLVYVESCGEITDAIAREKTAERLA